MLQEGISLEEFKLERDITTNHRKENINKIFDLMMIRPMVNVIDTEEFTKVKSEIPENFLSTFVSQNSQIIFTLNFGCL